MTRYALIDKSGKTRLTTEAGTFTGAKRQFIGTRKGRPIPAGWTIVKREVKAAKPKAPKFRADDLEPAPKKESPKKESPKKESPKKESPKKEAPKKEAPKKESPKKLKPGHFRMRMDSGDTLEFWLVVDGGGVSLKGARAGRAIPMDVDYIYTLRPDGTSMRSANISLPGLKLNLEGEVLM